jgi:hypothetical protein
MITINVDTRSAVRELDNVQRRQVPFATARALTQTAKRVETELRNAMASAFESASPYTARAQFVAPATKTSLAATVGIKDKAPARGRSPANILAAHFEGGARGTKPLEKIFRQRGILPAGWSLSTGEGMSTDRYGNPKLATVQEILGALKTGMSLFKGKGKRATRQGYFIVSPQRTNKTSHFKAPGIYRRILDAQGEKAAVPVFIFVSRTSYRKRIDLPRLAKSVVAREFQTIFNQSLNAALSSAK